jgi:hypothetical protein
MSLRNVGSSSLKNSDLASFVSNVTWNNYSFLSGWWNFLVEGGGSTHLKVSIDWQNRKTRTNIRVLRQVLSKRAIFCLNRHNFRRSYWAGYFIVQIDMILHRKSIVVSFLQPNKEQQTRLRYLRHFLVGGRSGSVVRAQQFLSGNNCHTPWDISRMTEIITTSIRSFVLIHIYGCYSGTTVKQSRQLATQHKSSMNLN